MSRQGVGSDVLGSRGSNWYCATIDQVLDFNPEGPTVICVVPRGIRITGATSVLVIIFWQMAGHMLQLDSSNEIGI